MPGEEREEARMEAQQGVVVERPFARLTRAASFGSVIVTVTIVNQEDKIMRQNAPLLTSVMLGGMVVFYHIHALLMLFAHSPTTSAFNKLLHQYAVSIDTGLSELQDFFAGVTITAGIYFLVALHTNLNDIVTSCTLVILCGALILAMRQPHPLPFSKLD